MIPLQRLPDYLTDKIIEYCDIETKRNFLMVDRRRLNERVLSVTRCIRVFPRPIFPSWALHPPEIPEDILVGVIRRYPNLEKMIIGPPVNNCYGSGEFGTKELPYLQSLISYLEINRENHLLTTVKKIRYREIILNKLYVFKELDSFKKLDYKKLNRCFLKALGHKGLESIKIRVDHIESRLTGSDIGPLLQNSPDLQSFTFDGFQSSKTFAPSFAKQSQLKKLQLLNWQGRSSTIESLENCEKLEELIIDPKLVYSRLLRVLKKSLSKGYYQELKRLECTKLFLENDEELDAITKKLPQLECLDICLEHISDEGMKLLGTNCHKLKILKFENEKITNLGLDHLTKNLPNLEFIEFSQAYNITGKGIAAIATNCKKLRGISIRHFKKIEKSGIDALIENCPDLKYVEFSYGDYISMVDMELLVRKRPNIGHIKLYNIAHTCYHKDLFTTGYVLSKQLIQTKKFYDTFPWVKPKENESFISSVKKLHKLTM